MDVLVAFPEFQSDFVLIGCDGRAFRPLLEIASNLEQSRTRVVGDDAVGNKRSWQSKSPSEKLSIQQSVKKFQKKYCE